MFVLLPDDPEHGLSQLENNITKENVKLLFSTLEDSVVNVRLPRFNISSDLEVEDALQSMGLTEVFKKGNKDLTLMAPVDQVSLSLIAHK